MQLIKNQKADPRRLDYAVSYLKAHRKLSAVVLQIGFLALSLLAFWVYMRSGKAVWSIDNVFHWERIKEVAWSIQHLTWPQFNHSVGYLGLAVNSFYPWLTLVPLSLLVMVHVPGVVVMYMWTILGMYMGLNIAYFSYKAYRNSPLRALTFSVFYVASYVSIDLAIVQSEDAEYISTLFAPLVLFGWLNIMNGKRGKRMLIWGLALMTFTHILSPLIMAFSLLLLTLFSYRRLDKHKAKTFVSSAVIFLLMTAVVWLPILVLLKSNVIVKPSTTSDVLSYNANLLPLHLRNVSMAFQTLWTLSEVTAFIMGVCRWKKLSYFGKRLFVLAVVMLLFNAQFLPWGFLTHTIIRSFQFPYRVSFVLRLALAFVFTELMFKRWKHADRIARTAVIGLLTVAFPLFISYEVQTSLVHKSEVASTQKFSQDNVYGMSQADLRKYQSHGKLFPLKRNVGINIDMPDLKSDDLDSQPLLHLISNGDYAVHAVKPRRHLDTRSDSDVTGVSNYHAQIAFTADRKLKSVSVPIMIYRPQTYRFYLDGKLDRDVSIDNGRPILHHVPKGRHSVKFKTPPTAYQTWALDLSLLGLILVLDEHFFTRPIKRNLKLRNQTLKSKNK